jgi:hypothetical protein
MIGASNYILNDKDIPSNTNEKKNNNNTSGE